MKTILLIFVSLILSLNTFGQIDFRDHLIIGPENSLKYANIIVNADLDTDGDQDLIVGGDGLIGWFENTDGEGNFSMFRIITEAYSTNSIQLVDFDGDNDLDLLFVEEYGNSPKIGWLENVDGQGNFGSVQVITDGSWGNFAYAADLDEDGDEDIILGGRESLVWYENLDGQGNFGSPIVLIASLNYISSVIAKDMDGDDDVDILFASNDLFLSWIENTNGQGDFGLPQSITNTMSREISPADIDGDGDMDIASITQNAAGTYQTVWFENTDGYGTFGPKQIITESSSSSSFPMDVDSDGDLDILISIQFSSSTYKVVWHENLNGLGDFGSERTIITGSERYTSISASDLDGDGDKDVSYSCNYCNDAVAWSENTDGLGSFNGSNIVSASIWAAKEVYAIDIDGDGDIDVLSASQSDEKLAWYENLDGLGTFRPHAITYNLTLANHVRAGDIDGDGDIDVVGGGGEGEINWYENLDGLGYFSERRQVPSIERNLMSIFLTDLDGDGDLDIVGCGYNELFWHENLNGLGNFGSQKIISEEVYHAFSLFAVDIDQDGNMDILSSSSDNNLAWYENIDGIGNFGPEKIILSNSGGLSVFAADFDNDGDVDVLSALSDAIVWFENMDGLGTFSPQKSISTSTIQSYSVYAADLDGDGDLDVTSASYPDHKIVYYENVDGLGTFGPQRIIADSKLLARSVFAADINGDNKIDVLSANEYFSMIDWYENAGPLGVNENQFTNNSTVLYPNPTDGLLYISSERSISKVAIYNQLGQLVLEEDNYGGIGFINMGKLEKGLYFVKLTDAALKSDVKKIIIK